MDRKRDIKRTLNAKHATQMLLLPFFFVAAIMRVSEWEEKKGHNIAKCVCKLYKFLIIKFRIHFDFSNFSWKKRIKKKTTLSCSKHREHFVNFFLITLTSSPFLLDFKVAVFFLCKKLYKIQVTRCYRMF